MDKKNLSLLFYTFIFIEIFLSVFILYSFPKMIPEVISMYGDGELPFYFYGYNTLLLFAAILFFLLELLVGIFLGNKTSYIRLWLHIFFMFMMFVSLFGVFSYFSITLKSVT